MGAVRRAQIVLLCEDKQQEVFVRRFLKPRTNHPIRAVSAPRGEGSGEQFVREQYPTELRALRAATVNAVLVVMIDGDAAGLAGRTGQLRESCVQFGIPPQRDGDRVVVLIPQRNIETWLAYLDGTTVDETTRYPRLERPGDCRRHVRALSELCERGELRAPAPPTLAAACEAYRNVLG